MSTSKDFEFAPDQMVVELRDEIRLWLKKNDMWSSGNLVAMFAIMEWRLQEQGYSLWGKKP